MSTQIVASAIGSGTIPYTYSILPPNKRGSQVGSEGTRTGLQVMIGNPEDLVAVDAFAASGISVGTAPIKIFGASQSLLPRSRMLLIENGTDSTTLLIAHQASKVVSEGWQLVNGAATVGPRAYVTLPILSNTDVWAAAAAGVVNVKMLIL